jgi:hypothetical protein
MEEVVSMYEDSRIVVVDVLGILLALGHFLQPTMPQGQM